MTKLQNLTPLMADKEACAFACHITSRPLPQIMPAHSPPLRDPAGYLLYDKHGVQLYDNYEIARHNNVTLRIDQLVTAAQQVTTGAGDAQSVPNQFRFAIYDYGATADAQGLTNIFSLSSDLAGAATAAGNISLMTSTWWGDADDSDTRHSVLLPAVNNVIDSPGDGSSPSSPQKYLFIVSDGVSDEPNSSCAANLTQPNQANYPTDPQSDGSFRCSMPIDPALCAPIKARGVKIGVVYTTYQPIPIDGYYDEFVAPFNPGPYQPSTNSQIAQNMQACASPGLYFEISPTLDIPTALQSLFKKAVAGLGTPHLQF
jgi:hypothetical protein